MNHSHMRSEESEPALPIDAIIGSPSDSEVVFVGPPGVGKTTAVTTLSTAAPVTTEVLMVDDAAEFGDTAKQTTTVGIDYGIWERGDGTLVGLFGTAGQDRFSHSRAALNNPDAGVVVWLFGDRGNLDDELEYWIAAAGGPDVAARMMVALNFTVPGALERARASLNGLGYDSIQVVEVDPRNMDDMVRLVTAAIRLTGGY
ncbi:hypothetical protein [Corynebacterium sp. CCM 9204]|uniref:hypothetical protein n=1 Tax=Corynebacterium sp. CCM 9204 TaxID=3057616 RepID=UPI003525330D